MSKAKIKSIIIFILITLFYILQNFLPDSLKNSIQFTMLFKPVFWIIIALIIFLSPKVKCHGKIRNKSTLMWWATLFASFYIILMVAGGLIAGFGKSPYSHSALGIFTNIITVYSFIFGREYSRHYLINNNISRKKFVLFLSVILLMTIINIPYKSILHFKNNLDLIKFIGNTLLPLIFDNILCCYLVYLGGPQISIIYCGIKEGFLWFSPVLPNLSWIATSLIGILLPFFILVTIDYIYPGGISKVRKKSEKNENPLGTIITMVISILMVWFAVGVFPVRPMVIATGSMEPVINKGDVVLVKRSKAKEVKVGDIVQYKYENVYIFHRIIDIEKEKNQTKFKTKGDNNSIPDPELVAEDKIKGKVLYVIPKIGKPTLFFKSKNSIDKKKVQF